MTDAERITQLETFAQQQSQVNFRYEILIRAMADVLGSKGTLALDEVNKRAEEIKAELIAQARAATEAQAATVAPAAEVTAAPAA